MAFPATPVNVGVFLQLIDGTYDITQYVYVEDGINLSFGRSDEASDAEPASMSLTLNNRDGRFTPRNPNGAYYGKLSRDSVISINTYEGPVAAFTLVSERLSAPDSVNLSTTGDIDLRWYGDPGNSGGGDFNLIEKWTATGNQRSYAFTIEGGLMKLYVSSAGTSFDWIATANEFIPIVMGPVCYRVTADVNNGAGGKTATFYVGPTLSGPWTPVGDAQISAGTTSIFDSTKSVEVTIAAGTGRLYGLRIYGSINETSLRAAPDFSLAANNSTSYNDGTQTWTCAGAALFSRFSGRFYGRVSEWPTTWDLSSVDIRSSIAGAGPLRRLLSSSVEDSAYRRAVLGSASSLLAYWPMEDGSEISGTEGFVSAIPGFGGAKYGSNNVTPSADADSFPASLPLPTLTSGTGSPIARVNGSTSDNAFTVRFFLKVPVGAGDSTIVRVQANGSAKYFDVAYNSAGTGSLSITARDEDLVVIGTTAAFVANIEGVPLLISVECSENGANVDFGGVALIPGTSVGTFANSSVASRTLNGCRYVQFNPTNDVASMTFGQLVVQNNLVAPSIFELQAALDAYAGEKTNDRISRLASEEGFSVVMAGEDLQSEPNLERQSPKGIVELLREAANADGGILGESKVSETITYRTRYTAHAQYPVTIPYTAIVGLNPTEDDQGTVNEATVSQLFGGTAYREVAYDDTALGQDFIGRYTQDISLSLFDDLAVQNEAEFRVQKGILDEPRFPNIELDLNGTTIRNDPALFRAILDLLPGDLVTITLPPSYSGSPDNVRVIVIGIQERIEPFSWSFVLNCIPAAPYDGFLLEAGDRVFRLDAAASTVTSLLSSSATSFSVTTTDGQPWVDTVSNPTMFPLDVTIGGERMTVSAISGTSSPQTFTVTRSVNGIVKSHAAGTAVRVSFPYRCSPCFN